MKKNNMIPSGIKSVIIADELIKSVGQFASDELKRQNKKRSEEIELPNVIELKITSAIEQLNKKGFEAEAIPAKNPRKEYASLEANVVVKMNPTPTLIHKNFLPGKLIKLYYVNETIIEESKLLKEAYQAKKVEKDKKVAKMLDVKKIKKVIPKKKDKNIKF